MPRVSFDALPDHGRLWIFPASRTLSDVECAALLEAVDAFLDGWAAHGVPLQCARELRDAQFLVIGVDEDVEAPSGCSIDALVNSLRALGGELGVGLIEHGPVWFRAQGGVQTVSRAAFRALVSDGAVDASTPVFDTTLTRVSAFRAGGLEMPAVKAWHGKAFFGSSSAATG